MAKDSEKLIEVTIPSAGGGLATNVSAVDSQKNTFRDLRNIREVKPGVWQHIDGNSSSPQVRVGGTLTNIPALPSGFTLERMFVYRKTTPSASDVVVIFGTKSSRDRFFVWPTITAGAWVTNTGSKVSNASINWLELTEAEAVTVNVVGSTTIYTLTGLSNGSSSGYYNGWWLYNNNRATFDYIIGSCGSGSSAANGVQGKFGITSTTTGDNVVLMRFPIFQKSASVTPYYQIDDLPFFVQHGEYLTIHTGAHDINSGPDLKLGFVGSGATSQGFFDDNDLDYNGWHFDFSHPFSVDTHVPISTITSAASTDDPIPWTSSTDYYLRHATVLFADNNESRVYFDPTGGGISAFISIAAADRHIAVAYEVEIWRDYRHRSDYSVPSVDPLVWSRFITKIRLYIAKGELLVAAGSFARPTTDWFFVKETDIDDAGWSTSGTMYTFSTTVKGTEWKAGQEFPFSAVQGFEAQKTGANAKFEAKVAGRSIIGPIFDDSLKSWRCLFSPIRLSGETSPDHFPPEFRIDVLHKGIYDIAFIIEQFGRLVLFDRDSTVICEVSGENKGLVQEQFQGIGCKAYRTVKNIGGILYLASDQSPLERFDGTRYQEPSVGFRIKDIWDALTNAQKEAAFAGYHKASKTYVIKMGSRIFLYDTRLDQWSEYETALTYVDFAEGVDGQLYAATSSAIYELFADTPTESLACTAEAQVFDGTRQHVKRLRLQYKSNVAIKAWGIDDTEPTTLREKQKVVFLPQANMTDADEALSFETPRASVKFQTVASTDPGLEIEQIGFAVKPKRNV